MPNILLQQLENALPAGMQIPEELRQLYQWIEDNGYYEDRDDGVRYGYLYPKNPFRNTYLDDINVDIDIAFYCVNTVEEAGNWEVVKKRLNFNKVSIRAKGIDIFVPMGLEDSGLNDDFEGWYDAMMYES